MCHVRRFKDRSITDQSPVKFVGNLYILSERVLPISILNIHITTSITNYTISNNYSIEYDEYNVYSNNRQYVCVLPTPILVVASYPGGAPIGTYCLTLTHA